MESILYERQVLDKTAQARTIDDIDAFSRDSNCFERAVPSQERQGNFCRAQLCRYVQVTSDSYKPSQTVVWHSAGRHNDDSSQCATRPRTKKRNLSSCSL